MTRRSSYLIFGESHRTAAPTGPPDLTTGRRAITRQEELAMQTARGTMLSRSAQRRAQRRRSDRFARGCCAITSRGLHASPQHDVTIYLASGGTHVS
jgi:hypothetical protein